MTFDAGTGLVHTAPGHGDDDFVVGQKYNLPVISPIDAQGYFTNEILNLKGCSMMMRILNQRIY